MIRARLTSLLPRSLPRRTTTLRLALLCAAIAVLALPAPAQTQPATQPAPDCQAIAWLPPMATLGGPSPTVAGSTELGLGFGVYGELLPDNCGHVGDNNEMMRYLHAMSDRMDFGFDFLVGTQGGNTLAGTPGAVVRYRITPGLRAEGGLGVADGGGERDLNADLAAVLGTHDPAKTWNYYMSLRVGGARGCVRCGADTNHAPGAIVPLGVIGTTARVSETTRFVMEAGLGGIFTRQYSSPAPYVHLSCGVLFSVGRKARRAAGAR
jgi:hypothetical protein